MNKKTEGFFASWHLVYEVMRTRPLQMGGSVFCLLIAAMLDGIGLLALFPAIGLFLNNQAAPSEQQHWIVTGFNDALAAVGVTPSLPAFLLLIMAVILLKTLLSLLAAAQVGWAHASSVEVMRRQMLTALMQARWQFFAAQRSGHIANSVSSEAQGAGQMYSQAADLVSSTLQLVVYIVSAILIAWQITIVAGMTGLVMMVLLSSLVKSARHHSKRQSMRLSKFNATLIDYLGGIKGLKAMGLIARLEPLLQRDVVELQRSVFQLILIKKYMVSAQEAIRTIVLLGVVYFFVQHEATSVEALLTIAVVFLRSLESLSRLQRAWQSIAVAEVPFRRASNFMNASITNREVDHGKREAEGLREAIELRDVSFTYEPVPDFSDIAAERVVTVHPVDVLRHFNLTCEAGHFICILGGSGAGKTTLIDLIIGLVQPTEGSVLIDGVPLTDLHSESWRHCIGYVPQEVFLFNASIRDNITLGDETIPDDAIYAALISAGALDFVNSLDEGLDASVGERGSRLSGGQRQRICIARALVRQPKLLILDEATSALDSKTEQEIAETVRSLTPDITVIAITHRPALANLADRTVHIADGKVLKIDEHTAPKRTDHV